MDVKETIKKVESSKEYKRFIKENPSYYIVHAFSLVEDQYKIDWQIGYYSKDTDKIIIIEYKNDCTITIKPEEDVFKEKHDIERLDIKKVNINYDEVMMTANKVLREDYKIEEISKTILLLQNIEEFGQIWNITLTTAYFNVINIKIDAATGEVLKHSKESLMGWNKK